MRTIGLSCFVLLVACGSGQTGTQTALDADRLVPARLYPLQQGNAWAYDIQSEEGTTLAITRVLSSAGSRVEVSSGGNPVTYEVRPAGIYRLEQDVWLLKKPIQKGASWPSANGLVAEVMDVNVRLRTTAGEYRGCVLVKESGGEGDNRTILTTYCPDVGPVRLESRLHPETGGPSTTVIAQLRGYQVGPEP